MKSVAGAIIILTISQNPSFARSSSEIFDGSTKAIVYLEAEDSDGRVLISGTGFIVSRDGYVVTVAHNYPDGAAKLFGVIGARQGTRFQLEPRESNEERDVALWQFPQSTNCKQTVPIAAAPPKRFDRAIAIGFPGDAGLTPANIVIQNLSTPRGLIRGDGLLQTGFSGGPVLDEMGEVIGIVQGGTINGVQANDFIPIVQAHELIQRRTSVVRPGKIEAYDNICYSVCAHQTHGVVSWKVERPWPGPTGAEVIWSGEYKGGHTRSEACGSLVASYITRNPGSVIEVPDDEAHMGEKVHKDLAGQVSYKYWCRGTERRDPIYVEKRSEACPRWE